MDDLAQLTSNTMPIFKENTDAERQGFLTDVCSQFSVLGGNQHERLGQTVSNSKVVLQNSSNHSKTCVRGSLGMSRNTWR